MAESNTGGRSAPLVSVLMTAYNREQFIAEAIQSVLGSRMPDFELIVVDDQSSDGTLAVAQRFAQLDDRVRVYQNQKNLGDYPNRNRAAEFARGTYLKYVDSDDRLRPDGLDVMIAAMERFPEAGFALSLSSVPADEPPSQLTPADAYREHFLGDGVFVCGPSGSMIRTDAFRSVGGFSGLRYIGDLEMWSRLGARFPLVLLPPGVIDWREHEGQEYNRGIQEGLYPQLEHAVSIAALTAPECPLPDDQRRDAIENVRRRTIRHLRYMLKKRRLRWAARLYREASLSPTQVLRRILA
jgi:glycosyltransferase involved in cell wall biosynthesis